MPSSTFSIKAMSDPVLFMLECSYPIKLGLNGFRGSLFLSLSMECPYKFSKAYGLLLRFPFPCVMMVYGRVTFPSRALTPNIQFNKEVHRMKALLYLVLLVLMLC